MSPTLLFALAAVFFLYSLVNNRLESTLITGPMLFLGFGLLLGPNGFGFVEVGTDHSGIHLLVEITLVLVLFADAAAIDISKLKTIHALPVRMLLIGLPLTVGLGTLIATFMFPQFSLWEAALLAAILTPTDAALGQAVITHPLVPEKLRQTIVVESGLNDGMALPLILLFASLVGMGEHAQSAWDWVEFVSIQLTFGPLAGLFVGYLGARLVLAANRAGWMGEGGQGIAALAVAIAAYGLAEIVHGNGFVAAFIGGLAFGNTIKGKLHFLLEFQEVEAKILTLMAFLVVGLVLIPAGAPHLNIICVTFGLLSLTVQRMLPIGLSLTGTGVPFGHKLFLGWFGPRGLASVLFLILVLDEFELPHADRILTVVMATVVLSVILHGVSAAPLAAAFGRGKVQASK